MRGKLGAELSVQEGRGAARLAALVMLAYFRQLLGSLGRVRRVMKVLGMSNASPDFDANPMVIDGFSDAMVAVFGEAAVGMITISRQGTVEVEMIFEVERKAGRG